MNIEVPTGERAAWNRLYLTVEERIERKKRLRAERHEEHREEENKAARDYWKSRPEALKNDCLSYKYGITLERYGEMFNAQNGRCAICGEENVPMKNGKTRMLGVDHDHQTGKVRGLLCNSCNNLLGYAHDNTEFLTRAIEYLGVHA